VPVQGSPLRIGAKNMRKSKGRFWEKQAKPKPARPQFYLTEAEKRDGESSRIQKWLELADRLFDSDDSDPTPSAA